MINKVCFTAQNPKFHTITALSVGQLFTWKNQENIYIKADNGYVVNLKTGRAYVYGSESLGSGRGEVVPFYGDVTIQSPKAENC